MTMKSHTGTVVVPIAAADPFASRAAACAVPTVSTIDE
jgi:hypothetical protein